MDFDEKFLLFFNLSSFENQFSFPHLVAKCFLISKYALLDFYRITVGFGRIFTPTLYSGPPSFPYTAGAPVTTTSPRPWYTQPQNKTNYAVRLCKFQLIFDAWKLVFSFTCFNSKMRQKGSIFNKNIKFCRNF